MIFKIYAYVSNILVNLNFNIFTFSLFAAIAEQQTLLKLASEGKGINFLTLIVFFGGFRLHIQFFAISFAQNQRWDEIIYHKKIHQNHD